jgi:gliding motility-associated-like protein
LLLWTIAIFPATVHGQSLPFACAGSMESYGVKGMPNSVFEWVVDGGTILSGAGNDTIILKWDYQRRNHSIAVTEHTEYGCAGVPVEANLSIQAPVADLEDQEEVCQDDKFTFDAETSYLTNITYLWSDSSNGSSLTTGNPGYVWVKITGTDGCADYDSSYLTVNPLPLVYLGKDTALCGTSILLVDAGSFAYYNWSTGDNSSSVTVDADRTEDEPLWVEVTDEKGCVGADTMILEVCDVYLLFSNIPNTITPGDKNGQNDTWIIPNIELFPDAVLEIYDRWGRLIYRTTDVANNPWNGETMSGKELPMDAYYYVLDIKVAHTKAVTGYVNLIR